MNPCRSGAKKGAVSGVQVSFSQKRTVQNFLNLADSDSFNRSHSCQFGTRKHLKWIVGDKSHQKRKPASVGHSIAPLPVLAQERLPVPQMSQRQRRKTWKTVIGSLD